MDIKHFYIKWNGKLKPEIGEKPLSKVIVEFLDTCREAQLIEVIIRKHSGQRTQQMNRYIHWMFGFIANETGQDRETVKSAMKKMFLTRTTEYNGKTMEYVQETKSLSIEEADEFIKEVRQFWFDFIQLDIPEPNKAEIK